MRIANVQGRAVTFVDGAAVDIAEASEGRFGPAPQQVWEQWEAVAEWGRSIDAQGGGPLPAEVGAPVPRPRQAFGIGLNYADHAAEAGRETPELPMVFSKFPSCIVGQDTTVRVVECTDWEIELVVVIGRRASEVPPGEGWSYVAGLTIGQDLSDRDLQIAGRQLSMGKSRPGFGPTGPWVVSVDELPDPDDLALSCEVGGEVLQSGRTRNMVHGVGTLVEFLAGSVDLLPGDLIFTGTPEGVGHTRKPVRYLAAGTTLISNIEGIGTLRTRLG